MSRAVESQALRIKPHAGDWTPPRTTSAPPQPRAPGGQAEHLRRGGRTLEMRDTRVWGLRPLSAAPHDLRDRAQIGPFPKRPSFGRTLALGAESRPFVQQLWEEDLEAGRWPGFGSPRSPRRDRRQPGVSGAQAGPSAGTLWFPASPFPSLTLAACLVSEQSGRLGET